MGFMKHHPEFNLRQSESTSLASASGINKVMVDTFFATLEDLVDLYKITAEKMFNVDETSHTVVQCQDKFLAQRGKCQVGASSVSEGRMSQESMP